MHILDVAGDWVIFIALPAPLLFILFYAVGSPWRQTLVGRALMSLMVAMAALLLLGAVGALFDYSFEPLARVVIYTGVTVSLWRLFVTMLLAQRRKISRDNPNYSLTKALWRRLRGRG